MRSLKVRQHFECACALPRRHVLQRDALGPVLPERNNRLSESHVRNVRQVQGRGLERRPQDRHSPATDEHLRHARSRRPVAVDQAERNHADRGSGGEAIPPAHAGRAAGLMLRDVNQLRPDRVQDGAELAAVRDVGRDGREPVEKAPRADRGAAEVVQAGHHARAAEGLRDRDPQPSLREGITEGTELGESLHRPGQARSIVEGRMRVEAFHHDARQRGHCPDEVGRIGDIDSEATQTAFDLHVHGRGTGRALG